MSVSSETHLLKASLHSHDRGCCEGLRSNFMHISLQLVHLQRSEGNAAISFHIRDVSVSLVPTVVLMA